MKVTRVVSSVLLAASIVVPAPTIAFADGGPKLQRKLRKKDRNPASPGLPSGAASRTDAKDSTYGGPMLDTIREHVNVLGQTVYSVAASHFDVSPPLSEMAARFGTVKTMESEAPENPELPSWRQYRSDVPDPVVQAVVPPVGSLGRGEVPLSAPTAGFNFLGVGTNGLTPSDSNGSAGNDQYVETVNTRYQVWSLDRSTSVATSILGPTSTNTLWSGFGGACQAQNSGDPIVLYDKVAGRWLISQFTTSLSGGFYFQCVAISTSPDATGTYYRYAFAVPGGVFGDYPHFGVWTDAYYMMAHAFQSTSGGYVAALFAAMDRSKMLAGDPSATWQVIQDPMEAGHMPADLDGYALPPTGAAGIFLSLHTSGMFVYRMKVDFTTPANTVRTLQANVPVAAATGACGGGGACIPQPGTTQRVGSLADRLMFRAAYRNFIDHESLVISHSVDPSVTGVVSGVRWYDFRLSGPPDPTCPVYPCIYQQGTVADVANGRSRWMPSIAMDAAENILVGYSTTGMTAGTDNQSIRYTGRARSDPPGTMTVPEVTIVTGTANNGNTRWGDYTSMSVDPADDCTFWYVNQYFTSTSAWSTRIASATWPNGSGAGQCPAASCTQRPASAPTIDAVGVPGDNQITVVWTGVSPQPGAYAIERADGTCGSEGAYKPLGSTSGGVTTFTDTTVQGGISYSYRVLAAADPSARCQSPVVSDCLSATATGACNLKPSFGGVTGASSAQQSQCGVTVAWTPAVSGCPLTPNMRYNVFRGTTPDFVPSLADRIATCVPGPSSYLDTDNVSSGATYYYAVRAEDSSVGHGGECGGGNEDSNVAVVSGTAYGSGTQPAPGTWTDAAGDGTAFLLLNVPGPGDTNDQSWRFVKTSDDPGANHTPGGAYAYRNAGPTAASTYAANACAEMQSPPLTAGGSTIDLQYWERHQIEYHWDAIAVEYAVNGGPFNDVPAPSNDVASGCSASDDTTGWEPLSCTQSPPINGCGYPTTKTAFNGPLGSGTTCNDWVTSSTVTAYAHRCHPITGLSPGDTVRFRWRFSSDPGAEYAGFYLDDIAVTDVRLPNACAADTCAGQPDSTPCDDGSACTTGDACNGGACQPGTPGSAPGEATGVHVDGHQSTTVTWAALPGANSYDVVSSTLSDLRANGVSTATCLANDAGGAGTVDGRADPAAGDGYYYLVRGQNACGDGTYGTGSGGSPRAPAAGCP
jgi:hypothetical protein